MSLLKSMLKPRRCEKAEPSLFKLHAYVDAAGEFDYEQYRQIQEEGNKKKLDKCWATEDNIEFLCKALRSRVKSLEFGLCHGTRQGKEQAWFAKHLQCEVLGTEISETALQFPNTIQWDFHQVKPEWINSVDFIYSNAFDHSFDPEKCLASWVSCLRPNGVCIIEHGAKHSPEQANELDPFGADLTNMPYLIALWGRGDFYVTEVIFAPATARNQSNGTAFLVVRRSQS